MKKKLNKSFSVLLAGVFALNFSQVNVFAAESADDGNSSETSEVLESDISNVETSLEDDPVTLTLTPGEGDEAVVNVDSYSADEMPIPEGLSGGDKDNPAQIEEYGTDENGNEVSIVTTATYDDDGNISGYTVSAKTVEQSNPVESEDAESAIVKTTTTEKQDSWKVIEGEDGVYYLVSAQMSDVKAGEKNEDEDVSTLVSTMYEDYLSGYSHSAFNDEAMLGYLDFVGGDELTDEDFADYEYRYVGANVVSAIPANKGEDWPNWNIYQYQLKDKNGVVSYVYCADLATTPLFYSGYNIENVKDATYYDADAAAHITAIASNGYWGTSDGTGSLESVKQFLRDNSSLTEDEIASLTPGMAMAATQAALWYYGDSSDDVRVYYDSPLSCRVTNSTDGSGRNRIVLMNQTQQNIVKTLCDTLINLDPDSVEDDAVTLISKENFAKEASIILKGQDETDPSIFKTDITFTLEMVPAENDDLVVIVRDADGGIVTVRRLAGALKEGETMASSQKTDAGILYTIDNIYLSNGMNVTLNLSGTQELAQGVYIYSADVYSDSQTFVGVASGSKSVDLSVTLTFNVQEPTVQVQHDSNVFVTTATNIVEKADDEQTPDEDSSLTKDSEEEKQEEETEENKQKEEKKDKKDKKKSSSVDTASQTNLGWTWIFLALSFAAVLKLAALKRH